MPPPNVECPELARRLRYAYKKKLPGYESYAKIADHLCDDGEFRDARGYSAIDEVTVARWIKLGRFPEVIVPILTRILDEDHVPIDPPDEPEDGEVQEIERLEQLRPLGHAEYQAQVASEFLKLAQESRHMKIDVSVATPDLRFAIAWLSELAHHRVADRVGTVSVKTICPRLLPILEEHRLIVPGTFDGFPANLATLRSTLSPRSTMNQGVIHTYLPDPQRVQVIGHFKHLPCVYGTLLRPPRQPRTLWVGSWTASDAGRLGIEDSWVYRLAPEPPTRKLFRRFASLIAQAEVPVHPELSDPHYVGYREWLTRIEQTRLDWPWSPQTEGSVIPMVGEAQLDVFYKDGKLITPKRDEHPE